MSVLLVDEQLIAEISLRVRQLLLSLRCRYGRIRVAQFLGILEALKARYSGNGCALLGNLVAQGTAQCGCSRQT